MTSTDEDVPDLLEGLDRHQRRRAQGEATLSVLGTDLAFEAWAGRNDYQLVRAQPAALFRSVLEALFGHLRGRPVPERELFLERWAQWDTRASSSLVATMGFGEEGPREAFWPLLHEVRPPPAVLLDVTVVRLFLAPAVLELLGEKAWWMPSPLAKRIGERKDLIPRHRCPGKGIEFGYLAHEAIVCGSMRINEPVRRGIEPRGNELGTTSRNVPSVSHA